MNTKIKVPEMAPVAGPVVAAAKGADATVSSLNEAINKTAATVGGTQHTSREGMEKVMKTAEEFVAFGQGNLEAVLKSGQIWANGIQDISRQVAATAQARFDETMSTVKALATVKSLKDAIELQTGFARSTFEKSVAESGKLTDASIKLTEQALAPITARMTLAVEKFSNTAA